MKVISLTIFLFSTFLLFSQNTVECIDYGTFDDPQTWPGVGAPEGWDMITGSEQIDAASVYQDFSTFGCTTNAVDSPTGGTFVGLHINVGGEPEGISYSLDNLIPGQTYQIAFWYLSLELDCGISDPDCCADFVVAIGGEEYVFEQSSDWEMVNICFEAESESTEIILTGSHNAPNDGYICVDDFDCNDIDPCCPLTIEAEEEYETCPLEEVEIIAEYYDETGSADVHWVCDPIEGLNYLSSTNSINPVFRYPEEFTGNGPLEFEYIVYVTDDLCTVAARINITLLPNVISTFNFPLEYCTTDGYVELPTSSEEGIEGNWDISGFYCEDYSNESFRITFTPEQDPDFCLLETELRINIYEYIIPSFVLPDSLCRSEEKYMLPTVSEEGVEGFWNISGDEICFEDHLDGSLLLSFTPEDRPCTEEVEIEFYIKSPDTLNFNLPESQCINDSFLILPKTSLDGIEGYWSLDSISIENTQQVYTSIFTPADESCFLPYEYNFEISGSESVNFNFETQVCRTDGIVIPDSNSIEGIEGYWIPNSFLPDTVHADSIQLTWYNLDLDDSCVDSITIFISITNPEVLTSNTLNNTLCVNDSPIILDDSLFEQSVTGEWEVDSIVPENLGPGVYSILFTSDSSSCYENYLYAFEILGLNNAEFSLPDTICINTLPLTLPIADINGNEGQWNNPVIDIALIINNEITINFVPDTSCFNTYNQTIYVQDLITPEFDIPEYICWDSPLIDLPERSENNVNGTWNTSILDSELFPGNSVDLSFTPDSEECADVFLQSVSIVRNYELALDVVNPVSCSSADGSVTILNPNNQLEYSLDSGTTWTTTEIFLNLQAGNYSLLARLTTAPECIEAYDFELTLPDIPSIIESNINHSMDCDDPSGSIELVLDQNNVEFSIDNGQTWSTQNTFDNLDPDNYTILYRPIDRIDCEAEFNFEIISPTPTLIDEILITPLSGCLTNDGSILIEAQGLDLEFSIDGGQNWQIENLFENLSEGQYDIIVRSSTQNNCEERVSESILLPAELSIAEVTTNNITSCNPQVGSITILPVNDQWQYSIDNGQTWHDENVFTELNTGQYQIQVRDREFQDCIDETTSEISEESVQLILPEYEVMAPSDCEAEDAAILLFSSIDNVEYNINGENEWMTNGIYENLSSGMYEINIRLVDNPECRNSLSILIESVDCECPELNIDYSFTDFYCTDGGGVLEIFDITGYVDQVIEIKWDNNTIGSLNQQPITGWNLFTINFDENCEFSDSIFVEFLDPLSFILETFDPDCDEAENGTILITDVDGGQEPYNYSLNPEVFQDGPQFFNLSEGEYLAYVLDDNGCLKFQETSLENREAILNDIPQVQAINIGETAILNPLINASSIDSFTWSPSEYILNPDQLVVEVQPLTTTEFTLTIYHGDCVEVRSVIVEVIESEILYISNIFNPNSIDNNRFFVQGNSDLGIQIHELLIYDRWGNLVFINENFEINQADQGWDGYYNNQKVDPGVFVYFIKYNLPGSKEIIIAGSITIVY